MKPNRLLYVAVLLCVALFGIGSFRYRVGAQNPAASPNNPLVFRGTTGTSYPYTAPIDVIDLAAQQILTQINVDSLGPFTVTPDSSYLYFPVKTNTGNYDAVQILDTTTFTPLKEPSSGAAITIAVGGRVSAIAASPDGRFVYVLDNSLSLTMINRSQGDITAASNTSSLSLCSGSGIVCSVNSGGIAFAPDSSVAVVTAQSYIATGETWIIDTATGKTKGNPIPAGGSGVAIHPNGQTAYLTNAGGSPPEGTVSVLDIPSATLQTINDANYFSLGASLFGSGMFISTDGSTLFVPVGPLALVQTASISSSGAPTIAYQQGIVGSNRLFATEPKGNHVAGELVQTGNTPTSSFVSALFESFSASPPLQNLQTIDTTKYQPAGALAFTPVSLALAPLNPLPTSAGGDTVQFTVTDLHDTGVVWKVNGMPGGDANTVGTIAGAPCSAGKCVGTYTPPAALTGAETLNITATSQWNPSVVSATAMLTVNPKLMITTTSPLPNGNIEVPYSQALAATGGVTPYKWAIISESGLPPGLSLDAATGLISGTPTASGMSTFTVQVTDSEVPSFSVSTSFSITVSVLSITATSGTPQATTINTAFAPLVVTVKDSASQPVSGVMVTFTAPSNGASGIFAGGVTTATTNSSGIASATFTANGTAGAYSVTATVPGATTPATFNLTNLPVGANIASLTVLPKPTVVGFGVTMGFFAQDLNGNSIPVTWSVSGPGNIDANGIYTAPASANAGTQVTVSATVLTTTATWTFQLQSNGLQLCCLASGLVTEQLVVAPGATTVTMPTGLQLNGVDPSSTVPFTLTCDSIDNNGNAQPMPVGSGCLFTTPGKTGTTQTIQSISGQSPSAFCYVFVTRPVSSGGYLPQSLPPRNATPWLWLGSIIDILGVVIASALFVRMRGKSGRTVVRVAFLTVVLVVCASVVLLGGCNGFSSTSVSPPPGQVSPAGGYNLRVVASPPQGSNFVQAHLIVPLQVQ